MNQQASVASGTLSNYGPESDVRVVCGGASIKGRRPQQEDVIMLPLVKERFHLKHRT